MRQRLMMAAAQDASSMRDVGSINVQIAEINPLPKMNEESLEAKVRTRLRRNGIPSIEAGAVTVLVAVMMMMLVIIFDTWSEDGLRITVVEFRRE